MNKRYNTYLILATVLMVPIWSFIDIPLDEPEKQKVTELVESAYLNGAFNELDTRAMELGFHEDFAIFSASGEKIDKYPIATWIEAIEKRKEQPDFDPNSQKYDYKIPSVDVTGGSASVKVELFQDGEHIYTDYLSLLKFDSGWKIVAKVYHYHNKK